MNECFNFYVLLLMMYLRKKNRMRKATQINDILVKILKQNAYIFSDNIWNFFSFCVKVNSKIYFKLAFKKVFYLSLLNCLKSFLVSKELCLWINFFQNNSFLVSKELCLWINFFQNNNVVFGRVILHKTVHQYEK